MNRFVNIGLLVLLLVPASVGQARLIEQRTRGVTRICVYEGRPVANAAARNRVHVVALGEPCPPSPPTPQAARQSIPSLARLKTSTVSNGRRLCVYTDHVRDYERAIPLSRRCPLTPHF